jgi:hypothetical protein
VLTDPDAAGESVDVMETWSDGDLVPTTFGGVRDRLEVLGPGSSALVLVFWDSGGGHWFNAFNESGVVVAADGQQGRSEPWPPTKTGLRFQEAECRTIAAVLIGADGEHLKADIPEEGDE